MRRFCLRQVLGVALSFGVLAAIAAADPGQPRPVTPRGPLPASEQATVDLFQDAAPSVVYISTQQVVQRRMGFFSNRQVVEGTGSGFVWDDAGHIVTNFHVIQNARSAEVILGDGTIYNAQLVGADPDHDLAVLRIDAAGSELRPIPVGTSSDLRVGQRVLAIGNPYGLDQTLTVGIVSALDRTITAVSGKVVSGVIQTDAAINPGNSGGPLLDSAGRLIGVNTAIRSPSGASAGIGFAVPVDTVNDIVPQLIDPDATPSVVLGIIRAEPRWERQFGVSRGVLIERVIEGSPADQAGLRGGFIRRRGNVQYKFPGDVITAIDDRPVNSFLDLRAALRDHKPGDRVEVEFIREDEVRHVEITLAAPEPLR